MVTRIAIPVVVGAALLAGAAMAASPKGRDDSDSGRWQYAAAASMAEKCTTMGQQTATAVKERASAKKIADARKMSAEGSKLCASNKQAEGVKKYEQALRDLGVKPQY